MASILIDESDCSIVLHCATCQVWFAFATNLDDAHERAAAHEQRAHPGEKAAQMARQRHATREAQPHTGTPVLLDSARS